MTVELLQTMSLVAFIAAGVMLLISVALFFLFDVPALYGDISGRTAKKAIEEIRQQNEVTGNKAYKPSKVNLERGKLTDKITKSGKIKHYSDGPMINVGTEELGTAVAAMAGVTDPDYSAPPNAGNIDTSGYVSYDTSAETAVLYADTYQSQENVYPEPEQYQQAYVLCEGYTIDINMGFTGSAEIIE